MTPKIYQTVLNLLGQIPTNESYSVQFLNGERHRLGNPQADTSQFCIIFHTDAAVREVMANPSIGFGEAFMRGDADLEGDIQKAMALGFKASDAIRLDFKTILQLLWNYFRTRNTLIGSKRNIAAHYDLGNDFYSLWLDAKHKQYTCAYYQSENDSLEKAQDAKLDLVCQKLRLQPGQDVVEAGCGWGGFALHAARKFGVKIRSYNISQEQIAYARKKAMLAGIGPDRIEYVLDDYRNIGADGRTYDRFVSIGMLEHVGLENYTHLFDIIRNVVRPQGLALVHSIGREFPTKLDPWLNKYIFPGAYIPALSEIITPIESKNGPLQVIDVENLRYHYSLTCSEWSRRLMKNKTSIINKYNKDFFRMFYFYLEASAATFRYGNMMLFQVLIAHGLDNHAPLTREHFFSNKFVPARKINQNGRFNPKANGTNGNMRQVASPKKNASKK